MKPLRVLVLAGGGIKGAYEVGAVKMLADQLGAGNELPWEIYAGVSAGALNVARLGGGTRGDLNTLTDAYLSVEHYKDVYDKPFLWPTRLLRKSSRSLYEPNGLRRMIARYVDVRRLRRSGHKTIVGAVSLDSGQYRAVDEQAKDFEQWVLASASFPLAFPPVYIAGQWWVDGGVKNVTPFKAAVDAARAVAGNRPVFFDIVVPSPVTPQWGSWQGGLLKQASRVLGIWGQETRRNDLRAILDKNERPGFMHIHARVVCPERPLPFGSLEPQPGASEALIQQGMRDAARPKPLAEVVTQEVNH